MDGVALLPLEIAEALRRGSTVVTANQRAARTLRRGFDLHHRSLGFDVWQPPAVMAWEAWTAQLWKGMLIEGRATRLLLNRSQEHAVWRQILAADTTLRSLRDLDSLAEMAAEAWRRLSSYNGQQRLRSAAVSSDTRAFQRWASTFQRRSRDEDLLSRAQLEETLRQALEAGTLKLQARELTLVGFDRLTPAQAALIDAVRAAGSSVHEIRTTIPVETRVLAPSADEQDELFRAARWVRTFVEQRPGVRVAVIVPAQQRERAEIDRVFREVLAPELQSIEAASHTGPYEFSLGVPLAETPMVETALSLLHWSRGALPLKQVSTLLLSPYFAISPDEQGARAEFDAFELRRARLLRPEISLDWLVTALDRSPRRQHLNRLSAVLRAVLFSTKNHLQRSERQTHAAWAARVRELLEAAAWGTAASQTSVEFQTRDKWEGALDELATLDFDGVRVQFAGALASLERIARQTMFAPQSHHAPVQVMDPLEAAGSTFDAVWFLRAGDHTWPTASSTSPLLPWQMQRDLGMPGTDVTHDSEHARQTTERIADSTPTIVFSYARESAEGRQRPSPALGDLALTDDLALNDLDVTRLSEPAPQRPILELETIEDTAPIQPLPDRVIHGGARILELQAACGFRAFAEHRLWSTELEPTDLGLDARAGGTVVHHALESFWDEMKTQSELRTMPPLERTRRLDACIVRALAQAAGASNTPWDHAYMQMQRERLRRLLEPWLDLELTRPPFEVKQSEKRLDDVRIGPLRLSVRVDRVDVTEAGEIIIDYKTGAATPTDWLTERPDAPQLPLYAVLSGAERLKGVAFGLVRAGVGLDLTGYGDAIGTLPHQVRMRSSSLEAQVEEWKQVLVDLATQFAGGDARVAPKTYPKTCAHCAQRVLCRLNPSLLDLDPSVFDGIGDFEGDPGEPSEANRG